jgi:hypothetical protein
MFELLGIYDKRRTLVGNEVRRKATKTPKEDFKSFCAAFFYAKGLSDRQIYVGIHPLTFLIFKENIKELFESVGENIVVDFTVVGDFYWFNPLLEAVLYAGVERISFSINSNVDSSILHFPNLVCIKMRDDFWKGSVLNNRKKLVDLGFLFRDFGVKVIAEGINNEADYVLAVSLGFDLFQGSFFEGKERFATDENFA